LTNDQVDNKDTYENAANPAPPVKLNVGLALASNDGTEPDEKLKPPEDDPGAF